MNITCIKNTETTNTSKILLIGIGTAGSSVVQTAAQRHNDARLNCYLCDEPAGCANEPKRGRRYAITLLPELDEITKGCIQKVILISALGGGTGSGATPLIANYFVAKGVALRCVVSLPFEFEGEHRQTNAKSAVYELLNVAASTKVINLARYAKFCNPDEQFGTFMDKVDLIFIKEIASLLDE